MKALVVILAGGVAFTSHSSKAATRLVVNHSPEPFSNIGLSLFEDLFVPFGVWFSLAHPLITLAFLGLFLAIFAWVSPKVFRLIRLHWVALRSVEEQKGTRGVARLDLDKRPRRNRFSRDSLCGNQEHRRHEQLYRTSHARPG